MKEENLTSVIIIDRKVPMTGRLYSAPKPGTCYLPWQTVSNVVNDHPLSIIPHNRTASALLGPLF